MIKKKKFEKQELRITGTVVRVKTEDVKSKTGEFYYNEDKTQTKKKITVDLYVGYEVISNKEVDKYYRIGLSYYPGSYKGIMDMVDQMYDLLCFNLKHQKGNPNSEGHWVLAFPEGCN